jgi:hypothetical protein
MRKLYLFVVATVFCLHAGAQTADIRFTITSDTVTVTNTDSGFIINDDIYNVGLQQYQGVVGYGARMYTAVGDTILNNGNAIDSTILSTALDTGGVANVAVAIHIPVRGNPYFAVGPPIGVIIWPLYTAPNGNQHVAVGPNDSLRVTVTVLPALGIEESSLTRMYLIQHSGSLNIQFGDYRDLIQQVSLYNIEGQLMYTGSAEHSQNIPTGNWSEGIYFCQITTYKGEKRTIKFVLQQ